MPKARVHQQYAEWFQRARCAERGPLVQELQEARWLVRNVEQRYATIQRVAEAIMLRHGIVMARRTVTKYRGQLKIPAVDLRKAHPRAP